MSSALTVAAVTAILKDLLENELIQQATATGMGDVTVTTLPPDRIAIGSEERPQINLYLYRLTPNTGWRSMLPAGTQPSQQEQMLSLDLHYLLSAYSEHDFQAEMLLGTSIDCLQKSTYLSEEKIGSALTSLTTTRSGNAALKALVRAARTLPLKQIKVTSEFLSLEDYSKLWSSFQAHARLSVTYQVSVLLSHEADGNEQPRLASRR